jgi:hypothetical protein
VNDIPPDRRSTHELYEQFRHAGARKAKLDRAVRRRRWIQHVPGPVLGAVLAFLVVGSGIAVGTKVFAGDDGSTLHGDKGAPGSVRAAPADRRLARAWVQDPSAGGVRWGMLIYQNTHGDTCVAAGRLVGRHVGRVSGGRFAAYAASPAGAQCPAPTHDPLLLMQRHYRLGDQARTLIYGVADRTVTTLRLLGATGPVPIAPDGSFLIVGIGDHAFLNRRLRITRGATTSDIRLRS